MAEIAGTSYAKLSVGTENVIETLRNSCWQMENFKLQLILRSGEKYELEKAPVEFA